MPVLLVIVGIGLVFSQIFFLPGDATKTANSALWSIFSLANVYFWLFEDTSYFAPSSEEIPFLHLWSLGIEEQFYLIWPVVLIFLLNKKRGQFFLPVAGGFTIFSFLFGQFAYNWDPSFMYYMLPARMGELLTGALAAHLVFKQVNTGWLTTFWSGIPVAMLSLIGLTASFILISEERIFPGFQAIAPTLFTALLIYTGHGSSNLIKKVLSLPFLVQIGKLSYSAYLWHWLILAFYRYFYTNVTLETGILIFLLTFILSYLSYTFIEVPFRYSKNGFGSVLTDQYLYPSALLLLIILTSAFTGGYIFRQDRDKFLSPYEDDRLLLQRASEYEYVCMEPLIDGQIIRDSKCVLGPDSNEPARVLLWGDSNAAHYTGMVALFAERADFRFRNVTIGACPPLLSDPGDFVQSWRVEDCRNSQPSIRKAIDEHEIIIISASWLWYQRNSDEFMNAFYRTADSLSEMGKKIILLGKAPQLNSYDPLCNKKKLRMPWLNCRNQPYTIPEKNYRVNRELQNIAEKYEQIEYADYNKYICPEGVCFAYEDNGLAIYYDSGHIDIEASWRIGNRVVRNEGVPFPFSEIRNWLEE